jgi:hypothetical protein
VRTLGSRQVYRNAWMTVREDQVERDDGSTGIYGVVDKPDFALVIPAADNGFWPDCRAGSARAVRAGPAAHVRVGAGARGDDPPT